MRDLAASRLEEEVKRVLYVILSQIKCMSNEDVRRMCSADRFFKQKTPLV